MRRRYSYVVMHDAEGWHIRYLACRAGRYGTEAEAIAVAERLAREACALGGVSRLVIERDNLTEMRLFRREAGRTRAATECEATARTAALAG